MSDPIEGVLSPPGTARYTAATTLSIEDLHKAIEKIEQTSWKACGVTHPHVINPLDVNRPTICTNCGGLVNGHLVERES